MSSNHRVNKSTTTSSNRHSKRKKNTEFSMSYLKGIPDSNNNNNNSSSTTINTIKIDCIFNLDKRKEVIDKWNTEISLIIQTNPEEFSHAKALLLLVEHKSAGIVQNFIKGTTWNEDLHGEDLFDQIINAIYMMFLDLDFMTDKDR
ncbi:putative caulimovirus coat protein [Helianthus debilis subsp. tardiflorus]